MDCRKFSTSFVAFIVLFHLLRLSCLTVSAQELLTYSNPIIHKSLPDPTVIRTKNGLFYLYATEDTRNLPIWKSKNLVDWEFVGTAFTKETHPTFFEGGMLWAPDINYIKGKYVMYYSLSKMSEHDNNGIGVAVSKSPEGPFVDKGKLFTSQEIGVKNSIDEFFYEEGNKKYLFWGSFRGIYGIELQKDGLAIKRNAQKRKIAGTFMEATAIEKRNGYYYLFGSVGSCCKGADSNYHISYGRSKHLFGPYLTKDGKPLMENNYEILLEGNKRVAGPGHQSRIVKDDCGQDWLIYHGYLRDTPQKGRVIFMDRIEWINGWPYIKNAEPSLTSVIPFVE